MDVLRLGVTNSAVGACYQTVNDTATAPEDFIAQSGTVTFAAGQTNKTIIASLNDDALLQLMKTGGRGGLCALFAI